MQDQSTASPSPSEEQRACVVCGNVFGRAPHEATARWIGRAACGSKCGRILGGQRRKAKSDAGVVPRECIVCGNTIARREREDPNAYAKRLVCSRQCHIIRRNAARAIDWQPKHCVMCGAEFMKRDDESAGNFRKKKTCSRECWVRLRIANKFNGARRKREYPVEWTYKFREQIRNRDGRLCQICGRTRREGERNLEVHHIDHNKQHCDPSNLITLCQRCHRRVHGKRVADEWERRLMQILQERNTA